ncbi:MAG: 50S ribosomal protein L17 [Lewinellaceae bacterium]|nr:50S ribosomal protein L17 [Saprospiraceae bacterium]MCB9314859.1 50S ribosomal protein L17 [Lewinellaceae bacterium]MCB9333048.1 50S ribosomal protein L17 [Lewinellaceae bacterium]
MRHGDKINNLGRTAAHRRAMLANMAIALIEHKRITTTLAKAKALRRYVEPLITKAKNNTTHSRRVVFSYLQNKEAIKELFGTVADKIGDRPGGYVRVIKLGFRRGDGAETAMIELVDFNEVYNPNAGKEKKTKRTRRGGSKKPTDAAETETTTAIAEAPVEDVVEDIVEEEVIDQTEDAIEEEVVAAADEVVVEDVVEEAPAAEEENANPENTETEEDSKDA